MYLEYKELCTFCGKPAECTHHLIFGMGLRELSDNDALTVSCCNKCHNMGRLTEKIHDNIMAEKMSKIIGQLEWEANWIASLTNKEIAREQARKAFRKRYGKSYI